MKQSFSLWPEGIENQRSKAPVAILREQAAILGDLTKNLVQGEVYTETYGNNGFQCELFITSPALGNYRYQLLYVQHEISLYPVDIFVEDAIREEIKGDIRFERGEYEKPHILAQTEEEFLEALKLIFRTNKTVQVITALLSQADPNWEAKGDWPVPDEPNSITEDDIPF